MIGYANYNNIIDHYFGPDIIRRDAVTVNGYADGELVGSGRV